VYDGDKEDSWIDDKGYKEGLLEYLTSPSYLSTNEKHNSEPQYDILDPENKISIVEKACKGISCSSTNRKRYRLNLKILYLLMIQCLFGWSIFFNKFKMLQRCFCNQTSIVSANYLFILCYKKIIIISFLHPV
jgi:hypothetical protein